MHIPVLLHEVLSALAPQAGEIYLDATFGGGGYTRAILETAPCHVIGIDRDEHAIERAKTLQQEYPNRFLYAHARFSEFPTILDRYGIDKVDGIIFDLGLSSYQLDQPDRGFSFRFDAPLTMTMGCNDINACDIVNTFSEKDLMEIFWHGGEQHGRKIAHAIVKARQKLPILTTTDLATLIQSVKPPSKDGKHSATVAFQALRIFINEELQELEKALKLCHNRLKGGGRLVVVTFHSLEDRIVKDFIRRESGGQALPSRHLPLIQETKKPAFYQIHKRVITPSEKEIRDNPRSRSAKLRYALRSTDV